MSVLSKYLFFYFIALSFGLFAQDYNLTMIPLNQDGKLAGNRVSTVHQDQDGYIWLLTQNGVARYDGHQYKWFNKANSKLRDIPKPNQIAEDAEGYIWLNQYNKIDLICSC